MGELVPITNPTSATDLAALFDPSLDGSLSGDERSLLAALLSQDERIDIAIPEDTPAGQLWETITLCAKVFTRVNKAHAVLKLLIGRALVLIQQSPEIYERRGFRSFDQFMTDDVRGLPALLGISRGELYKSKSIAEANPTLPMADYREIGFSKLAAISQVTREGDSNYQDWIDAAKTNTFSQLKEKIYRSDANIPEGSLERDLFALEMTAYQKSELEEFINDPQMRAASGSENKAELLLNATREARVEWLARVEAAPEG